MPDYDFRRLSDDQLLKICEAGEDGAGYKALQEASVILAERKATQPKLSNLQYDENHVIELTDEQIATIQKVLEIMPD